MLIPHQHMCPTLEQLPSSEIFVKNMNNEHWSSQILVSDMFCCCGEILQLTFIWQFLFRPNKVLCCLFYLAVFPGTLEVCCSCYQVRNKCFLQSVLVCFWVIWRLNVCPTYLCRYQLPDHYKLIPEVIFAWPNCVFLPCHWYIVLHPPAGGYLMSHVFSHH